MGGVVVFDVETQRSFAEVGGRDNFKALGVSLAVAYQQETDTYQTYRESELARLVQVLLGASLVVGFNVKRFDYAVLSAYSGDILDQVARERTLDIFEELEKRLGHRVSLNSVAVATLEVKKSGSGLDALKWYREGRFDLIERYCRDDVRLTKELYEYGKKHGWLYYEDKKTGGRARVEVSW